MDWRVGIAAGCALGFSIVGAFCAPAPVRDDARHYIKPKSASLQHLNSAPRVIVPTHNESNHYVVTSEALIQAHKDLPKTNAPDEDGRYIKVKMRRIENAPSVKTIAPIHEE